MHPLRFFDTSGDGKLTPIDALRVVNGIPGEAGEFPEAESLLAPALSLTANSQHVETRETSSDNFEQGDNQA